MFQLVRGNTYYWPNKTNVGLIKNDDKAILIDSGNDKDAGRKIRKYLEENNLSLQYILNTHSNADHIGGNGYLLNQFPEAKAYSMEREVAIANFTDLEPALLYGGRPAKIMTNKFLMAKPSKSFDLSELKYDIEYFKVPGHYFDMVAYKTSEDVCFLGDCLFPEDIITKYHLFYMYDPGEYLKTLEMLKELNNSSNDVIFIPSHCELTSDIGHLITINENKVNEVTNLIKELTKEGIAFDNLLKKVFDYYELTMDLNQYLLVGSTIRNYLSYLNDKKEIDFIILENTMYFQAV